MRLAHLAFKARVVDALVHDGEGECPDTTPNTEPYPPVSSTPPTTTAIIELKTNDWPLATYALL